MAELPLHLSLLRALADKVSDRREEVKETMAKGLPDREYAIAVGRAREAQALIDLIEEMLKAAMRQEFDDIEIEEEYERTRKRNIRSAKRSVGSPQRAARTR